MSYHHFTLSERQSLVEKVREGKNPPTIAKELGRNESSVRRELKRNSNKDGSYDSWRATCQYLHRRKKCVRRPRLEKTSELSAQIVASLEKGWSPEVIVGRMKRMYLKLKLAHSTIYRAIKRGLLPTQCDARQYLARKGKRKYGRREKYATIKPDYTIHDRPVEVELRQRIGDWEGDTIVSGGTRKGCLFTAVDRASRLVVAARSSSQCAEDVEKAMIRALHLFPVKTLTLDNGSEFARHRAVSERLKAPIFFADPHAPWQRGSNENANGKIRYFFPKMTDFSQLEDEKIDWAIDLLNDRPRKCLDWLTPREVFHQFVHLT